MKRRLPLILLLLLISLTVMTAAEEEVSLFQAPPPATTAPQQDVGDESQPDATQAPAVPPANLLPDGSVVVTISAVGDLTFGGDVRKNTNIFERELKKQNNDLSFVTRNVREILSQDDMTIANLETTLTTAPVYKKDNRFVFSAPPEYVEILEHGSIEAVSFENNHALDHGETGIAETQEVLTAAGITWSTEKQPAVFTTASGIRIGLLSYQTFNGQYPRLQTQVPNDIANMKAQADIVLVSYHWGEEEDYAPNARQQQLGRLTIDAGADLVVGHHSHRINPIELYNGKYIVYSLANFSFAGNNKPSDMSSFIFQTRFAVKDGVPQPYGFRIIPMRISSKTDYNDFIPTPFTDQRRIDNVINVLLSNGKKLEYAVAAYPQDWE